MSADWRPGGVRRRLRFGCVMTMALWVVLPVSPASADNALSRFVAANSEYRYEELDSTSYSLIEGGLLGRLTRVWTVHQLLVSGTRWQAGAVEPGRWRNEVLVLVPRFARGSNRAIVVVGGGSNEYPLDPLSDKFSSSEYRLGIVSVLTGATLVVVRQVPNQPLRFAGLADELAEDDAISHSFSRFFETGDETWPLLFPMVNAVVHAMNAAEDLIARHYPAARVPASFHVTGTSKRGWTSWLTAVADPRVGSIAPTVFDMLNIRDQLAAQREFYRGYSSKLTPYRRNGVIERVQHTPRGDRLIELVDPFSYRQQLALPKLVILTTGDDYWTLTSARHYREQLAGPTIFYYRPNCDHSCTGDPEATVTLYTANAEFLYRLTRDIPLPATPVVRRDGSRLTVALEGDEAPKRVTLWYAHAPTRDFRFGTIGAAWRSLPITQRLPGGDWTAELPLAAGSFTGFYVDAEYASELYHGSAVNRWLLDRTPYRDAASRFRVSSAMHLLQPTAARAD